MKKILVLLIVLLLASCSPVIKKQHPIIHTNVTDWEAGITCFVTIEAGVFTHTRCMSIIDAGMEPLPREMN